MIPRWKITAEQSFSGCREIRPRFGPQAVAFEYFWTLHWSDWGSWHSHFHGQHEFSICVGQVSRRKSPEIPTDVYLRKPFDSERGKKNKAGTKTHFPSEISSQTEGGMEPLSQKTQKTKLNSVRCSCSEMSSWTTQCRCWVAGTRIQENAWSG